jgi:hypothetical protein
MPHPGDTDDRRPVPLLVQRLVGRRCGGKGYIAAPLAEQLFLEQGLRLITKLRKNMRNILLPLADHLLLRKRALIETVIDQLKNVCQIERSRHRSPYNFLVYLLAGLVAYCYQPKKPSPFTDASRLPLSATDVLHGTRPPKRHRLPTCDSSATSSRLGNDIRALSSKQGGDALSSYAEMEA